MESSVIGKISKLRQMSVDQLRDEWLKLHGEPARSTNREHLFRRLAWRTQELALGGLSDRAEQRIRELAPKDIAPTRTPSQAVFGPVGPPERRDRRVRDSRLPSPGTVIIKTYKGAELRVAVRDDGYEYDGAMFASLTAVAKHVTACRSINGKLFFGLSQRKRG